MTSKITHKITVHFQKEQRTVSMYVPEGENILHYFEDKGENLPFSCRNGCCTSCAVRILSGQLDQKDGIGLSKEMQTKGYALLCIAKAIAPLEAETQNEDEVYEIQFGKYLEQVKAQTGSPFDI